MESNKEYFAFISYKSEDVEWATWLQHELEHYHLPASFNGRTDVPKELRPVFRDIDELSAGNLPDQIRQALENSQNLIVICSPKAAESPWVNQEVETFISIGKTDRIFPFIVEGNSPSEFFPPALRNLPKNKERLGGDVSKKGRDAAFVKVVAGMLGVGFDSLWNRYEKEKAEEERKIREQRDKLLIMQSRFLAEKANALVDEGDSYTARLLAIKALPEDMENPRRPYTAEAEAALINASQYENAILRGHYMKVNSAIFSSDGKRIVSASGDNTLRIWNAKTGQQIGEPLKGHESGVCYAAFSPDGKYIVSASWDETVRLWNANTGQQICEPLKGHHGRVSSANFSHDGKLIVSASGDRTIRIWDVNTGKQISKALEGHVDSVEFASFSPDNRHIVSASRDNTIRIWDVRTGREMKILKGHQGPVNSALFSADGKLIVSASSDFTIRIWDAKTGREIQKMDDHDWFVRTAVFSPNGRLIVSSSDDETIRLWDVSTGQQIGDPFKGHGRGVCSAVFSPDGKTVVSASLDNTLRIWDICHEWQNGKK